MPQPGLPKAKTKQSDPTCQALLELPKPRGGWGSQVALRGTVRAYLTCDGLPGMLETPGLGRRWAMAGQDVWSRCAQPWLGDHGCPGLWACCKFGPARTQAEAGATQGPPALSCPALSRPRKCLRPEQEGSKPRGLGKATVGLCPKLVSLGALPRGHTRALWGQQPSLTSLRLPSAALSSCCQHWNLLGLCPGPGAQHPALLGQQQQQRLCPAPAQPETCPASGVSIPPVLCSVLSTQGCSTWHLLHACSAPRALGPHKSSRKAGNERPRGPQGL